MRRDIYIGMTVSLAIHAGFALLRPGIVPVMTTVDEVVLADRILMPPLDLEPEPPIDTKDPAPPPDIGLPRLDEPLVVAPPDAPLQPPSPPVPNGPRRTNVIHIPTDARVHAGPAEKIYELIGLDREPRPTYQAKPVYPFEQRRTGTTGQVVVGFVVDARGMVRDVYIVSSTLREFESAAMQAVGKWTFKPGRKDGVAVSVRMQVPMVFSISSELQD